LKYKEASLYFNSDWSFFQKKTKGHFFIFMQININRTPYKITYMNELPNSVYI